MNYKRFLKDHRFILIISLFYGLWIIFLTVLAILNQREVIFYDALSQNDISNKYCSNYPFLRYLLEPVIAVTFILKNQFTWIFLILIIYPILRIIYFILKRYGKYTSAKHEYMKEILRKLLKIAFEILSIGFLAIGLFTLIGYAILGLNFFNRLGFIPLQIGTFISTCIFFFLIAYFYVKLRYSNLKAKYLNLIQKKIKKEKEYQRKITNIIKKELIYLGAITFILFGMNTILISIHFTPHKISPTLPLNEDEFLFDFHSHTIMSDGWLTPEDRILWYMEQGISGAAISDHNNIQGALIAQEFIQRENLDFILIIAEEWTDHRNNIHMNYYGIEEEIVPLDSYRPGGPRAMNASDLIAYVKNNSGYVIVNHYNYYPNPNGGYGVPYTLEQLKDWGVDGFEITNMGDFVHGYEKIRGFCLNNSLICMGASDIHTNRDLNSFMRVQLEDPTNLTVTNIFKNLKNNTHEVVIIKLNPKVIIFPEFLRDFGLFVVMDFCNYILNLDRFQALSWILWTSAIFVVFLFSYRKIKKIALTY
ncbi:MAG: hypothetical protein EU531_07240 [Promethearchaeota archaeon]|nr:MAG: hypothetical protein EU531_07240 [Candidatus Lokiarchaeota archaeon]